MSGFALSNCYADSYRWIGPSVIEWTSTDMVPVGAFSRASGDIWLMLNKNYTHSADESFIPNTIRICVHLANRRTGPTERFYYLLSSVKSIRMNEGDGMPMTGFQFAGHELYALPVVRKVQMQRDIQYYSSALRNGSDLPSITFSEQQGPTSAPEQEPAITSLKQGLLMLDLRIEPVDNRPRARDYC